MNWATLRKEALEQSNYICSICGTKDNLHVHHNHYPAENLSDTLVACAPCHFKIHRKHWKINGHIEWKFEVLKKLAQKSKTLKEISEIFQVSRERIRQKLKDFGIKKTRKAPPETLPVKTVRVKVSPKLKCLKCEHSWIPRIREVRVCPRCKNAYWDVPKKIKTGEKNESNSLSI